METAAAARPAARVPGRPLPATLLVAASALLFCSLFFGGGIAGGGVTWIGTASVATLVVAATLAILGKLPLPALTRWGIACTACLVAFVVWSGVSIFWSIEPDRSWDYLNRDLVYLAFAALGLLVAAALPREAVAGSVAGLLGLVMLWALLGKVVPSLFPDGARVARLRNPIGYWNSLALAGAVTVPLALWLASVRSRGQPVRIAGVLLLYVTEVALALTYSRAGIVLAVAAGVAWLAAVPDRLETLLAAVVASAGAAVAVGFAFARPALTNDGQTYHDRLRDGLIFGGIVVVAAMAIAAVSVRVLRLELPPARRRRLARRLGAAVAVVVVAGTATFAAVRGGSLLDEFRDHPGQQVSQSPSRFTELSSSNRWAWWKEAWTIFTRAPLHGKGAGTFELARTPIRTSALVATEPHDIVLQDLAETGIVGALLGVGLAVTGAVAIVRRLRRLGPGERAASVALAIGLAAYTVHLLVDIDWDFIAVSAPAFFVLGTLLARRGLPGRLPRAPAILAAGAAGLAVVYSLLAPWIASRQVNAAYDAIAGGRYARAVSKAKLANELDPLSLEPLEAWALAATARRDYETALSLFRRATARQPENGQAWFELGQYEWLVLRCPLEAYRDLNRSYTLDPWGPTGEKGGLLDVTRAIVNRGTARPCAF